MVIIIIAPGNENRLDYFTQPSNIFELTIPTEQTNIRPHVTLCKTTMPDGAINNSDCL